MERVRVEWGERGEVVLTWTLADNRDHKALPGLAMRRRANSR